MLDEEKKMLAGKLYDPTIPELEARRVKAHALCQELGQTPETSPRRQEIQDELFPDKPQGLFVQGPAFVDYGTHTHFGKNVYLNANLTILDTCEVVIGDNCMIGPNASFVTPMHPLLSRERNLKTRPDGSQYDQEYGKPLTVEANCWLASNVTVTGGVTIGHDSVIGAGSVVTRDIPANSLAVGNPCRVIRTITEADSVELKKALY